MQLSRAPFKDEPDLFFTTEYIKGYLDTYRFETDRKVYMRRGIDTTEASNGMKYDNILHTVELDGKIIARRESLLWVRLDAPGLYVVCTEAEGEGVIVDGEIYHVRGCPVLPGKQTVKLDYYEL